MELNIIAIHGCLYGRAGQIKCFVDMGAVQIKRTCAPELVVFQRLCDYLIPLFIGAFLLQMFPYDGDDGGLDGLVVVAVFAGFSVLVRCGAPPVRPQISAEDIDDALTVIVVRPIAVVLPAMMHVGDFGQCIYAGDAGRRLFRAQLVDGGLHLVVNHSGEFPFLRALRGLAVTVSDDDVADGAKPAHGGQGDLDDIEA